MGFDCEDIGSISIQTKSGERKELTHEESVRICKEALENGKSMEDIIKKSIEPDLKIIRLRE